MIKNYLSKNSKKLFLVGLYRPEDFYFAHLLEHCLAVDLGKRNIIRVRHANIGGGYIFISGNVENVDKAKNIQEHITLFNIDKNLLNHQKKVLITEKLYRDRVNSNRDIYESLETNSKSLEIKEGLYNEFISCEGEKLEEKIKIVFESIKWVILDESFDQLSLQRILNHFPKIQENRFKFAPYKASNNFVFAEIDIEISSLNKMNEFVIYLLNKRVFKKIQDMHILYGTHTIANNFAETWNKRSIVHYSGYFPKEYSDDFFDAVTEGWRDIIVSTEDEKLIKNFINDYVNNRTIKETIMELFEYGCLVEKGWEHKFHLDAILLTIISKQKIHKRVINTIF